MRFLQAVTIPSGAARRPRPARARLAAAVLAAALGATLALVTVRAGDDARRAAVAARAHAPGPLAPSAALPAGALGIVSSTIGADSRSYRVHAGHSGVAGENKAQHLSVRFTRAGAQIRSAGTTVGFGVPAIGFGSSLHEILLAGPTAHANETIYAGAGIAEWYRNGPLGVEQGFDISRAPAGPAAGLLTIAVPLSGNAGATLAGGTVTLSHPGGATLSYTGLTATDARGKTLPSRLELGPGSLRLLIDTAGAHYPLRVDPLLQQGPKLTGSGEAGEGSFGLGVAISGNGQEVLVGGPTDNNGVGAVWAFARSGSTWNQQGSKITATGEAGQGQFGYTVALSEDGTTALIGGGKDNASAGAAWVFTRSGSTWTQQGPKLTGGEEVGAGHFGCCAVALSSDGNTALIGGYGDNSSVGAAWVFTRSGSTWTQQGAKLTGAGESGAAHFGYAVALSGDGNTALIGGGNDASKIGAAWVFTRSGSSWSQQGAKLVGGGESGAGQFGYSVALSGSGDMALIGAGADAASVGAAWTFTRSGSTWSQSGSKLTATEEVGPGHFGCCGVALSANGGNALIGGYFDNAGVGAAWQYTRSGSAWVQVGHKLTGGEEVGAASFGRALSLSADGATAVIGGPFDHEVAGAAWMFAAGGQPSVVSEPASSVTQSTATLNATVDPEGETVSNCHFEYGTTESYGASVPCSSSPGSGTAPVPVSAAVEALTPGTTYHFRIVATNPAGTSAGADTTLRTLEPQAPAVVTDAASAVAQTSATLNATVNPSGEPVSDCHFEYGTSESYGTTIPCSTSPGSGSSPVAVSADVKGLAPSTTYHFRIVATNPTGTGTGTDGQFATTTSEPPAVVTKPASAVGQTSATLNATVNPEDEPVSDCHFEYGTSESYGTSIPCSASPGSGTSPVPVSAGIENLAPNTTYHFRIVATNPIGTSTGADATFKTPASQPPAVVTEPASAVGQTSATLNATVNPEDEPVSDCHFEYGTSESYGTSVPCSSSPGSGLSPVPVSAGIENLAPNTTYHFRIVATNPIGTSAGADTTFKTPVDAPAAVTKAASRIGVSVATLNATVNPEGEPVSDCHFEYGTSDSYGTSVPCSSSPGSGSSPVAVSAGLEHLTPGTGYHFRIVATNPGGTVHGADAQFSTTTEQLPELGRCVVLAKATGKYKSGTCTSKSTGENTGKYEWVPWPAAKNGFAGKVEASTIESAHKAIIKCTGGSVGGEYDGPRHAALAITLTGCEASGLLSGTCQSEGAASGEVRSAALQAQLGTIKTGLVPATGWELSPLSGTTVAGMSCGGTPLSLTGAVIGQVTALDKMSPSFTLKFKGSGTKQTPERFEGGPQRILTMHLGGGEERAGLTATAVPAGEENMEIKAIV